MHIFLSSFTHQSYRAYRRYFPNNQLNVMFTFAGLDWKGLDLCSRDEACLIMVDSGAFSLNNSKSAKNLMHLNVVAYAKTLKKLKDRIDYYFNFDERFDAQGFDTNIKNQRFLESHGLQPIPVLHSYSDEEINFYAKQGYKMVSLGKTQNKIPKLREAAWLLHSRGIKVHILGCTRFDVLATLPITSCDSAVWSIAPSMGYVYFWNKHKPGFNKTDRISFNDFEGYRNKYGILYNKYKYRDKFDQYLESIGINYLTLMGDPVYARRLVCIDYFRTIEKLVTEYHNRMGFFK